MIFSGDDVWLIIFICTSLRSPLPPCVLPQMAIMAGVKWKAAPKDDFYQEVLDLLGDISMDTRKELEAAVKAEEDKKAAAAEP